MELPNNVYQILVGSLLGDGSIARVNSEHPCCRYSERHCAAQLPYLEYKVSFFSKFFGGNIRPHISGKGKPCFQYNSSSRPLLTQLRNKWYPDGKKCVNLADLERLEPLGLAVWYQDDGNYCYYHKTCRLDLSAFGWQSELIRDWFKTHWGLSSSFCKKTSVLTFSTKPANEFLMLISPFVHPCLIYKFGPLFKSNLLKLGIAYGKKKARKNEYRRWKWRTDPKYRERELQHRKKYPSYKKPSLASLERWM